MKSLAAARRVFESEIIALEYVIDNLGINFDEAVRLMLGCSGRVIVCGMGKSGLVGKKISASLSSTGTPSFFLHPAEAIHGDLGMICSEDVFIAISYSGETSEVVNILPYLQKIGVPIIAMSSNDKSSLARVARTCLSISVPQEACPLQLAPTSSSTAALVLGDALTVALMESRGFTEENFAQFHPGGALGRKLLSSIRNEMISANLPVVNLNSSFADVINVMTAGELGLAIVLHEDELLGVITDGDIRRSLKCDPASALGMNAEKMMSFNPITIDVDETMSCALNLMEDASINRLLVLSGERLVGVLKK